MRDHPYLIINATFAFIITAIFLYSLALPLLNNYNLAVQSNCENMPEALCKSRGLSRGFSKMIRFDVEAAQAANPYTARVFFFFLIQFGLRILFSFGYRRFAGRMIIVDIILSTGYFLLAFFPFVSALFGLK